MLTDSIVCRRLVDGVSQFFAAIFLRQNFCRVYSIQCGPLTTRRVVSAGKTDTEELHLFFEFCVTLFARTHPREHRLLTSRVEKISASSCKRSRCIPESQKDERGQSLTSSSCRTLSAFPALFPKDKSTLPAERQTIRTTALKISGN